MNQKIPRILRIDASNRGEDSVTRQLANQIVEGLLEQQAGAEVIERDLNQGMEFIDPEWIGANFTPEDERSDQQRAKLSKSDALIQELDEADILVITAPMYNFSVPAVLKAWIDLICRAKLTFAYTENGPVGLLRDRPVYLVVATGGVPLGSPVDFVTPYMKQVLSFIGLNDVRIVAAQQINMDADAALAKAKAEIQSHLSENEE